jgi:hypothetical protein
MHCGISIAPMSESGQNRLLPQRNIDGRFTSISRHTKTVLAASSSTPQNTIGGHSICPQRPSCDRAPLFIATSDVFSNWAITPST